VNIDRLKQVLAVPTESMREDQMVAFLQMEMANRPGVVCTADKYNNVFIRKGKAEFYPCVAAHIDSVQPLNRHFKIVQQDGLLIAHRGNKRVGFGADDKAGVYICLELIDRFDTIAVALFAGEEIGCRGALSADSAVFDDIGYVLEFDCPAGDMMSYTSSGMRLFHNGGDFIKKGFPVLNKWGITKWQHHPYSDVMALRKRFNFSCMNLSSGYYNWHASNECVKIADTANSLEMAADLVNTLGAARYEYEPKPLIEVTGLVCPVP
jgi:putative aminopeptidase FrvX